MKGIRNLVNHFVTLLEKVSTGNELWQFTVSLVILFAGFLALELLWRYTNRRIETILKERGFHNWVPHLSGFLPSLRLFFAALLLRVAEVPLRLPTQLITILHGLEAFLIALAFISLFFQTVLLLDLLFLSLPSGVRNKIPEHTLNNLKSILRIIGIVVVAIVFVYTQKTLFPEWLLKSPWWRYLAVLVVLAIIFIGGKLLISFLATMTVALKETEERARLRLVLQAALWPIRLLLVAIGVYAIKELLLLPATAERIGGTAVDVLGAIVVVLFAYRLLDVLEYELTRFANREDTKLDLNFVKLVRMITHVLVVVFGGIYILQAITGKPLNALLAGLGIGGLAVALAAQDTLKNFFGSIMIMLDKPFVVGNRVVVDGVDGPVEDIGFRCTRIRTLEGHLVAVPNEKMARVNIENIGRRLSIRRLTNITITYDTLPEKVERALTIIREILESHEGMDPEFPPRAYFNEFNDASLNILMIYWFFPPNYWDFLGFSERVNLRIMRAFEAEGIEFAFPTTTTYLAQDDRRPLSITIASDPKYPRPDEKS
ncbi:MAG: mechanosensitive ion channel [Desulfobacterales bacterium]|nr:mechanosensitive ion channel [Desulfobacterales bacterium]